MAYHMFSYKPLTLPMLNMSACAMLYSGVQQCFGVVYHELTTLRRVYFARAAKTALAK